MDCDLDRRPAIVAVAGPNGAGKTTFFHTHLRYSGLRLVNADVLARGLGLEPYAAARLADSIRRELFNQRESFVFETVFSDPAGEKLSFLKTTAEAGYNVILFFIGLATPGISEERVSIRVAQGGHDVPSQKLKERFPRTLANLTEACRSLPKVLVFDNTDLDRPCHLAAVVESGQVRQLAKPVPRWLKPVLPKA